MLTLFKKIRERIYRYLFRLIRDHRKAQHAGTPRVALSRRHTANSTLVPNRQALLELLPAGGTVAELGVAAGDFSADILALARPSKLYLVDIWAEGSQRYGEDKLAGVQARFAREIAAGQVEIVRGMSVPAADGFADASLDWIYIDTDHTYATTLQELHSYAPRLKPGGIIAGDDYANLSVDSWGKFGVMEAVQQFCLEQDWEFLYLSVELDRNPSFAIRKIAD